MVRFRKEKLDPVALSELFHMSKHAELKAKTAIDVKQALQKARGEKKPRLDELFTDVYDSPPPRLEKQKAEMWEMVNKYKQHYQPILDKHDS